jgi:predicted ATP-dependent protease
MAEPALAFRPLPAEAFYRACEPSDLPFETTADLPDLAEVVGQQRAAEAIRLGIGIRREGFNLFALGPICSGRHSTVRRFLEEQAAGEPVPSDWCYVNNFGDPQSPVALELPAGKGCELRSDVDELLEELRVVLPAVFESKEYQAQKESIDAEVKEKQSKAIGDLDARAKERGVALLRTPVGFVFAPAGKEGVLPPEEFEKLPPEERDRIEKEVKALQEELEGLIHQVRDWEREGREKLKLLDEEVATAAIGHLLEDLRVKYSSVPAVGRHLEALQQDLVEHVGEFLKPPDSVAATLLGISSPGGREGRTLRRYRVNVLVDHSETRGAPVVYEGHPSYPNLIGGIEHIAQMGTLVTDFSLVKAGALLQANGGYLILDAREVLMQPFAWESLKKALSSGEISIESPGQWLGLASTVSLSPEPIPLSVKVVLIGERLLYYLLCQLDPEFNDLFKVAADFNDQIARTPENQTLYARLIATLARREKLLDFDRPAVARLIERCAREAGDAERLSARIGLMADLMREADYWARLEGRTVIGTGDVEQAVSQQVRRADRLYGLIQEEILRGTILVDVRGSRVGQVNGISVIELGRFAFGRPSRITARVRPGRGEVIDIEREVELGGPIHSKGVLILAGFLGERYARTVPLALSASLVFEQSYGGVEGDSASSAELCALLSALAELPVKQGIALTGSVSQQGQIQAVGGINEKIEGFFDTCRARGLTGDQGVVLPAANVSHLMLRKDVVEAASAGKFSLYPVSTIDEAIEILTGLPAGVRDGVGRYPPESVNGRVESRLGGFAQLQREFARLPAPVAAETGSTR